MEKSSRLCARLLALALTVVGCALGNSDDPMGVDTDVAVVKPDAESPADAADDASADTDVGLDPTDVAAAADGAADAALDAISVDASDAGLDAADARDIDADVAGDAAGDVAGDVAVALDARVDAVVTRDAPDVADVSGVPDAGACPSGSSACNGMCVTHGASPGACSAANNVGSYCGDTSCGVLCPSTRYRVVATRTGNTSQWFRARAVECSVCGASVVARVNLTVPPGVNYDLFVHRPCGSVSGRSENAAGLAEQVQTSESESALSDDSFEYYIEVRHVSGASCAPWTLTIEARSASGSSC